MHSWCPTGSAKHMNNTHISLFLPSDGKATPRKGFSKANKQMNKSTTPHHSICLTQLETEHESAKWMAWVRADSHCDEHTRGHKKEGVFAIHVPLTCLVYSES